MASAATSIPVLASCGPVVVLPDVVPEVSEPPVPVVPAVAGVVAAAGARRLHDHGALHEGMGRADVGEGPGGVEGGAAGAALGEDAGVEASAGGGGRVCRSGPWLVQLTVSPTFTVTLAGPNWKSLIVTLAEAAAWAFGGPCTSASSSFWAGAGAGAAWGGCRGGRRGRRRSRGRRRGSRGRWWVPAWWRPARWWWEPPPGPRAGGWSAAKRAEGSTSAATRTYTIARSVRCFMRPEP